MFIVLLSKMVTSLVLSIIFAFVFAVSGQIWEQEIKFTATKTVRVTMSPGEANATLNGYITESPQPATVDEGDRTADVKEGDAPSGPFSSAFLNSIQQSNPSWTTNQNFHESIDGAYMLALTGLHPDHASYKPPLPKKYDHQSGSIPEEFDARKQWPNCQTIQEIRDQGSCGSCWAISTAEAMSDRACIHSNASLQFVYSVEDILSCCTSCGKGCEGGYPGAAWSYWKESGVVSGGDYADKDGDKGCRPYSVEPCNHHGKDSGSNTKKKCSKSVPTPKCNKNCVDGYGTQYQQDLRYGDTAYSVDNKVETIQREIMSNGPVVAAFKVFEDFLSYGDGVYQHVQGKEVGGHAVKLLGWGVDKASNLPYWLCANSWNNDWGLLDGFFKMKRGSNECNIESDITAGRPKVNQNKNARAEQRKQAARLGNNLLTV